MLFALFVVPVLFVVCQDKEKKIQDQRLQLQFFCRVVVKLLMLIFAVQGRSLCAWNTQFSVAPGTRYNSHITYICFQ